MSATAGWIRTALVLGRVSNLPTVWSNILAGWILAHGEIDPLALTLLLTGASALYTGGMFLNDFCDAEFDTQFRAERPISAGRISRRLVGILALAWFAIGTLALVFFGWATFCVALLLLACIVLYDFLHKKITWAPWLMAGCRFLLYPLAASAVAGTISIGIFLSASALAAYVAGVTYLARGESRPSRGSRWWLILFLLPLVNAFVQHGRTNFASNVLAALALLGWFGWIVIPLWRGTNRSIGRVVAGLLAGMVLVDIIAVAPQLGLHAARFLIFFALALVLQRSIPAT